jgi:hypothetical protein
LQLFNKQYNTISTQTYGLFYTSSKGIENKIEKKEGSSKFDTKPSRISAGRGYWRQQLDHICTHLKAYAHNNTEFKVLIAEPKLGQVNSEKRPINIKKVILLIFRLIQPKSILTQAGVR